MNNPTFDTWQFVKKATKAGFKKDQIDFMVQEFKNFYGEILFSHEKLTKEHSETMNRLIRIEAYLDLMKKDIESVRS